MYRVYKVTEREEGKLVHAWWDGDCYIYDIFESQEEYDEEMARIKKIDDEWRREKEAYLRSLTNK